MNTFSLRRISCALLALSATLAAQAAPATWYSDPVGSSLLMVFNHSNLVDIPVLASGVSGTASIEDGQGTTLSALQIRVDLTTLSSYSDRWPKQLQAADVLDTITNPQMSFVGERFVATSPNTWNVSGPLTLHGVTRAVTLQVSAAPAHGFRTLTFRGLTLTGEINWRDFNTQYDPAAAQNPEFGRSVRLTVNFELVDQPHLP